MNSLWWMIPVGAFILWCLIQFFQGRRTAVEQERGQYVGV